MKTRSGPCATCLRWSECNGVDASTCPLWGNERPKEKPCVPAYLDDREESGLIEED